MRKYWAVALAMALAGCAGSSTQEKDSHNHEEHESLQVTAYNDGLELFAEAHPFVTGEESEILCHITKIDNYKPLDSAEVEVTLTVGTERVTATATSATKPGIYDIDITPKSKGLAKMTVRVKNSELSTELTIDSIYIFDNEEDAEHYAHQNEKSAPNSVAFPKEKSWSVDFMVQPVEKQKVGTIIRSVAQIMPSVEDEIVLSAKASGIVTIENGKLALGSQVSANQTICYIDASSTLDNNINVEYTKAESEYNKAKAEYERVKALREDKLALESELQEAKTALDGAEARFKALKDNFQKGRQDVRTPKTGYIKQLLVQNGEFVNVGQPIATITNNRTLRLKAEVQPSYYPELKNITSANIRKINSDDNQAISIEKLNGKLVSFGKQISTENPMIPVIFEINNVGDYLPGTFVEIFIKAESPNESLTVPTSSIIEDMGNYFVYRQVTPELFEKRQVKIGASDGIVTEILNGVNQQDRVVSRGAMLVKLQQASGSVDPHAGHNHSH